MNTEVMFSSKDMTLETPPEFYDRLNKEFNFTLDPCCTKKTAKCDKYYTKKEDGLIKDWIGEIVFVNPPYGRELKKWAEKCYLESLKGTKIVMLIPARTDTIYFHEFIYKKTEIRFIKGRLRFLKNGKQLDSAPFPSMIAIFN